jgi:hypothetical protein
MTAEALRVKAEVHSARRPPLAGLLFDLLRDPKVGRSVVPAKLGAASITFTIDQTSSD